MTTTPCIPAGCDQQGRVDTANAPPDPAEACTDMGVDPDDLACATGIVRAVIWALAIWIVGAVAAMAVLWPVGAP